MRRIGLVLGITGAIAGSIGTYVLLSGLIKQRAESIEFMRLAKSDEVKLTGGASLVDPQWTITG